MHIYLFLSVCLCMCLCVCPCSYCKFLTVHISPSSEQTTQLNNESIHLDNWFIHDCRRQARFQP